MVPAHGGQVGDDELGNRTGLLFDAYFSGSKIAWLLDNVRRRAAGAEAGKLAFGTIDTFLLWRLTGGKVHATDATNASRTMLFNLRTQDWDATLLKAFDIPAAILPKVQDSASEFGAVTPTCWARPSRSPASPATSRRRRSARPASSRA